MATGRVLFRAFWLLLGIAAAAAFAAPPFTDDQIDQDLYSYAETCKRELEITSALPDLSCLNGYEVPITLNGVPVDDSTFPLLPTRGCDNPHWLSPSGCHTYDLIQTVALGPDIEAVLNCRQKTFTNAHSPARRVADYLAASSSRDRLAKYRLLVEFDDLGLILRNKKTGKTCFFTFFGSFDGKQTFFGAWIPAPDRTSLPSKQALWGSRSAINEWNRPFLTRNGLAALPLPPQEYPAWMWYRWPTGIDENGIDRGNMWFSPEYTASSGACVGCHSQGAFNHSPFIDQMKIGLATLVPKNPPDLPYLPVGRAFRESFLSAGIRQVDTRDIGRAHGRVETQACTVCHQLTSGDSRALQIVGWSVGRNVLPSTSIWGRQFPRFPWMPKGHGETSQESYDATYRRHIDRMLCCLANPRKIQCLSRAVGPTTADIALSPTGALAPSWIEGTESPACP